MEESEDFKTGIKTLRGKTHELSPFHSGIYTSVIVRNLTSGPIRFVTNKNVNSIHESDLMPDERCTNERIEVIMRMAVGPRAVYDSKLKQHVDIKLDTVTTIIPKWFLTRANYYDENADIVMSLDVHGADLVHPNFQNNYTESLSEVTRRIAGLGDGTTVQFHINDPSGRCNEAYIHLSGLHIKTRVTHEIDDTSSPTLSVIYSDGEEVRVIKRIPIDKLFDVGYVHSIVSEIPIEIGLDEESLREAISIARKQNQETTQEVINTRLNKVREQCDNKIQNLTKSHKAELDSMQLDKAKLRSEYERLKLDHKELQVELDATRKQSNEWAKLHEAQQEREASKQRTKDATAKAKESEAKSRRQDRANEQEETKHKAYMWKLFATAAVTVALTHGLKYVK